MNLPQFIKQFSSEELFHVKDLFIAGCEVYLAPSSMRKTARNPSQKPFGMGTYLGKQVGVDFIPSFQLLDRLMLHTTKKVTLNGKAEWLFICGRDVFKQGILEAPEGLSEGDRVLLQNEMGECLGLGEWKSNSKIAVKNVLDRGDFLRRER